MSSPRGFFPAFVLEDGRIKFDFPTEAHTFTREYLAGHDVYVEVYKRRGKRSIKQNRWLYSFLHPLADVIGCTVEELKLIGLVALWGTHDVMGYRVPVKAHTSDLNTEEFSDLCAWFQQKAAERGVLILDPSEWKAQQRKQSRRGGVDHSTRNEGQPGHRSTGRRSALEGVQPSAASVG